MSATERPATIVWFRQDLRLADNPALRAAWARGGPVIPVYIRDDAREGDWPPGRAACWWLRRSLDALQESIALRAGRLIFAPGDSGAVLRKVVEATGASAIHWNRRFEPAVSARDTALEVEFAAQGIETKSFNGSLLFEPAAVHNRSGRPFQVFGPFWRHCRSRDVAPPTRAPAGQWPAPKIWPASASLDELGFVEPESAPELAATWQPGEAAALKRLRRFVQQAMDDYATGRDEPARDATSGLSPHLHFGEIGPRQVWAAVRRRSEESGVFPINRGAQRFLDELGWREFAYHLLYHFPRTPEEPLRGDFARFPWREDAALLQAWQAGRTGYPIVDAGMRQLRRTGWMPNRVRMIVASFLVKHLRLSWREGAAWFWDQLVDADLASNTLGWQWSAGCGADAAPYFRIFNPTLQGQKFDPRGEYVRRWVPELAEVPVRLVHAPWAASAEVLAAANVALGRDYPPPVVEHAAARAAALAAFRSMRGGG